ncbi:hypothetical protein NKI01_30280 [Mesorhizobium sp. M0815]|uniref:hypothetical protein n=1 Tax=Mesorhizobium sp. M0815 TaxID=2957005 RepID=UPI003337CF7E
MKLLDHLLPDKDPTASHAGTLSRYLVKVAPPVPATAAGQYRYVASPYAPH